MGTIIKIKKDSMAMATETMLKNRIKRAEQQIKAAERAEESAKHRQQNWKSYLSDSQAALEEFRRSLSR